MVKGINKVKLRTFIKTYLSLKRKCSATQLAEAYNHIGFDRHDITTQQVASFLKQEMWKSNQTTTLRVDFDIVKGVKYYYLV